MHVKKGPVPSSRPREINGDVGGAIAWQSSLRCWDCTVRTGSIRRMGRDSLPPVFRVVIRPGTCAGAPRVALWTTWNSCARGFRTTIRSHWVRGLRGMVTASITLAACMGVARSRLHRHNGQRRPDTELILAVASETWLRPTDDKFACRTCAALLPSTRSPVRFTCRQRGCAAERAGESDQQGVSARQVARLFRLLRSA